MNGVKFRKKFIKERDFERIWPFTVPDGYLIWQEPLLVLFMHKKTIYALNGMARNWGYSNITPLWKNTSEGNKMDLGPFIQMGLDLRNEKK